MSRTMAAMQDSNVFTARQLLSRHRNPEAAFAPLDGTNSGAVSLPNARKILQTLTGVSLTPVELTALARKYGDKKVFKYRDFLADSQLLSTDQSRQSVVNGRSAEPARSERSGTPSRRTGLYDSHVDAAAITSSRGRSIDKAAAIDSFAQSTDSRLLQFGSDSMVLAPVVGGSSAAPLVAVLSRERARSTLTPVDVQRRGVEYGVVHAPVVGTALEASMDRLEGLSLDGPDSRSRSGASTPRSNDPLYHTGAIAQAGGLSDFMHVPASTAAASLPAFPGDSTGRRRPRDSHLFHEGAVARSGRLGDFVMDSNFAPDLVSRGQLPPLPMSTLPDRPTAAPRDPQHRTGALLQAGGVHRYGSDSDSVSTELSRTRASHSHPEIYGGLLKEAGGLGALASEPDSWLKLQKPVLKQGEYSANGTPRSKSAGRERSEITGEMMRGPGSARRRSMPDLIKQIERSREGLSEDGSLPTEVHTLEPLYTARSEAISERSSSGLGLTSMSLSRRNATLASQQLGEDLAPSEAGGVTVSRTAAGSVDAPISSVDCAHQFKPMAFGARSPVAASLAASSLARFDVERVAKMRQAMRAALPEKETAAAAVVRARLRAIDRDGDGSVSVPELLHGLNELCPSVDAAAVGMLVKILRNKPVEGAAAGMGSTDAFGESVPVAAVTSWLLEQQGGRAEILSPLTSAGVQGTIMAVPSLFQADNGQPLSTPSSARSKITPAGSPFGDVPSLPTLIGTNSSAVAAALHDAGSLRAEQRPAAGRSSGRELPALEAPYPTSTSTFDLGLDWSTSSSSMLTGRGKVSSYSELHRKKVTHAISSEFARGDAAVPTAGTSSQRQRNKEAGLIGSDSVPSTDRTQWALVNPKFESFKANWEARHGAAAMKELAADAAEPVPGPSWARASPAPFRVLRVAGGAPVPAAAATDS